MFRILFAYQLLYVLIIMVVQNWSKMTHLPQQQGPPLEISYILHFFVMTLHYYKLYQFSSL